MVAITSLTKARRGSNEHFDVILNIAERLFRENGYDAVGMREIASAAGLKPVQLYRLGLSKAEILAELIVRLNARQIAAMQAVDIVTLGASLAERVESYLLLLYRLDIADKDLRILGAAYGWLWSRKREDEVIDQVRQLIKPVAQQIEAEGLDRLSDRCLGIWSLYYVGFRGAAIDDVSPETCIAKVSGAIRILLAR